MKTIYTPAKRLRHDRERKHREREKLKDQGMRLRQFWATDQAWSELQPRLHELGITRAKQNTVALLVESSVMLQGASERGKQGLS